MHAVLAQLLLARTNRKYEGYCRCAARGLRRTAERLTIQSINGMGHLWRSRTAC